MAEIQVSSIDDLLFQIQQYKDEEGKSYPQLVHLLPSDNQIIDIDLSQRLIVAPHFLSVQYDHNAEVVYFKCDRYYDTMDLTNTVCLIQYKNAAHLNASQKTVRDDGLYWVPFYDIDHYEVDEEEHLVNSKIIIPWAIGGLATMYPGKIDYVVRFYQLSNDGSGYIFNMSTQVAEGTILHGMDPIGEIKDFTIDTTEVERIYQAITTAQDNSTTYWMDV